MTKFQLTRPDGPWDYPTFGFRAASGAILDGTLFDPPITSVDDLGDTYWDVYVGGSGQTGITYINYNGTATPGASPTDGSLPIYRRSLGTQEFLTPAEWLADPEVAAAHTAAYEALAPAPSGGDDTAALNAALAALPPGGTLILQAGTYEVPDGGLTIAVLGTRVRGASALGSSVAGGTVIECTTPADDLLTIADTAGGAVIEDLMIRNTVPTGTTKAGITSAANWARFRNVAVLGFYSNIDITEGHGWTMNDCLLHGPVKYALKVANAAIADSGDGSVVGCTFIASGQDSDAAIRYESGGGLKVVNSKINAGAGAGAGPKFLYGIDLCLTASTSDLAIANTSIENTRDSAIIARQDGAGTSTFANITINGGNIALYQSDLTVPYIDLAPANGSRPFSVISVTGVTFLAPVGQTGPAIRLSNIGYADTSAGNAYLNFPVGSEVEVTGSSVHVRTAPAQEIWVPANDFSIGFGTPALSAQRRWPVWLMDAASAELITATLPSMPPWLNFDVLLYWTNNGAGAGDVVWREDSEFKGDGDTLTDAGGASSGANVTAAAPLVDVVEVTTLATIKAVTTGKPFSMRIWRQAANAADTLANDAAIIGVLIRKYN